MSFSIEPECSPRRGNSQLPWRLGLFLVCGYLAANAVGRVYVLVTAGPRIHTAAAAVAVLAGVTLLVRPLLLAPLLGLFGATFFLFGFHSYRPQNHVFELLVSVLGIVLCLQAARRRTNVRGTGGRTFALLAPYALLAASSLLLLPAGVLEHRLFLEGSEFGRAILGAYPKDPLYPIASVNRLWLFLLFAGLLATHADGRVLFRKLFRGVAWAAIAAVLLGLLDFAGVLSLDRYNLSNLFYGAQYKRLQSTFGNPGWFACFVACALPFVWVEFQEARGRVRLALAAVFPLCAASLFLSGARAAWLAVLVLLASLLAAALAARRWGRALPAPDRTQWLALGATLVTVAVLVAATTTTATTLPPGAGETPASRLEGLSQELHHRGLGLTSPRRVAAEYALELARQKPLLGLGYESFNLHLRTQLEIQSSGVSKIVNTALAQDPAETLFDDSHNTYLQVLTGTGALGLAFWIALALQGLWVAARAFRHDSNPRVLTVLLGLIVFHVYGLFQGMAYVPVTFFLFPLLTGYATTLDPSEAGPRAHGSFQPWLLAAFAAVLVAVTVGYRHDTGYRSLKRRFGVSAYLPDEAAEFEGFYRPETGPAGEFRWMARRAIVNVTRVQPFRLRFTCEHPDADREPVVVRLRFEGRDAGQFVFRRPGAVEQRFSFDSAGALRLHVSRTFRPAAGDRRELGVAVSAIRWE